MRLKLDSAVSFCGLPAHEVWILNAGYIDKSFIRHRLSFDLFRAMGSHNLSPNGCYGEVYVGNQYQGLYYVMQRIDQERAGIADFQPGGVLFKEPPVFIQDEPGIVYREHLFGQKYPEIDVRNEAALGDELRHFLFHASDSLFAADVDDYFQLENVADWMLLLLLTNNTDGLLRNFYLYRLHTGAPFRIAIWDYDETFGRYGDNRLNNMETEIDWQQNPLLSRLMQQKAFRQQIKERWLLHRSNVFDQASINRRIDEYIVELEYHVEKNFKRWPVDGPGYADDMDFDAEVDLVRSFISKRLVELDQQMEKYSTLSGSN